MPNEYNCPLINLNIDETVCYDIQMVTSGMIKKSVLQDYDFPIDEGLVTKERAAHLCEACPFNQLKPVYYINAIAERKR
ncbi:MAG: hypothetical protein FWH20_06685 [Oscillospiraceae bacterium]|nr:hypothetical protein [Oscillospiraceae bacterium]